jgi:hypothetical protein
MFSDKYLIALIAEQSTLRVIQENMIVVAAYLHKRLVEARCELHLVAGTGSGVLESRGGPGGCCAYLRWGGGGGWCR